MSVDNIKLKYSKQASKLETWQISRAAKFIALNDKNPLELFDILGITDDLQKMRRSSRQKNVSTPPRMQEY